MRRLVKFGMIVIIFMASIFIHEMGHYLAFQYCNIAVETVSVGFPIGDVKLTVWQDNSGTKYEVAPLLLGGYTTPSNSQAFESLLLLPKIIILLAGVAFNFLLGFGLIPLYAVVKKSSLNRFPVVSELIGITGLTNLILGIYNLLFVFPTHDGGKIVQLFLCPWLGDYAFWVGIGISVLTLLFVANKLCDFFEKFYQ